MQDDTGWTALMHAIRLNKIKSARLLVEKEKNIKPTREVHWEDDNRAYLLDQQLSI